MNKRIRKLKYLFTSLLVLTTVLTKAQDDQGIRFENGLNWQQVLAKAKADHKYIFVDCYATWCGPCKYMEQTIYPLKEVGDVFNKDFISIKLQMDQAAQDDDQVKSWYRTVKKIAMDYTVNAYPTFLFFDANGNPVHKAVGALNAKQFIQLAKDAMDPGKQYYALLKNFQPGKLDTAEERGLALSMGYTGLGGKIAADYLERIPLSQFYDPRNGKLMVLFQADAQVASIATKFVKGMNAEQLAHTVGFIAALVNVPGIRAIDLAYIKGFSRDDLAKKDNRRLVEYLNDEPGVKQIAERYIAHLRAKSVSNSRTTVDFVGMFTKKTSDKGFKIFWKNAAAIDTVKKDPFYAQNVIQQAITNTYVKPIADSAKLTGTLPDWDNLKKVITKKYNKDYAQLSLVDGQVDYYGFLVRKKHQTEYWPQLLDAEARQIKLLWLPDPKHSPILAFMINNTAYNDFFFHEDDPLLMEKATGWLKIITQNQPKDYGSLDTYACLIYKADKLNNRDTAGAIALEDTALSHIGKKYAALLQSTLEDMKQNKAIWQDQARLADEQQP